NSRLMRTPGMRCSASATFLSGNLPMSSAVRTSEMTDEARLARIDAAAEPRMPVMTISPLPVSLGGAWTSPDGAALVGGWFGSVDCACAVPASSPIALADPISICRIAMSLPSSPMDPSYILGPKRYHWFAIGLQSINCNKRSSERFAGKEGRRESKYSLEFGPILVL